MRKLSAAMLALTLVASVFAEEDNRFPGVEGLMTDQEYQAAGLDKLSDAERKALNEWLIRYTAFEAPEIRETAEEVKQAEQDFSITATVKEPFNGWSGKNVFYLDNGQVWKQRTAGRFYYSGDANEVVIRKNFLGFYVMEHLESGREVGVRQLD